MFVLDCARRYGLTGWVRNDRLDDRKVELVAEGSRENLEKLLAAVQQGPTGARVTDVAHSWGTVENRFQKFEITY
jgi:acylphosphatase